ncbi:MAG: hypothetical protein WDW38_002540 [Sanguina aurantia]
MAVRAASQTAEVGTTHSHPVSSSADPTLAPFERMVADKKFMCTMCGKCCTGEGEVWVSDKEATKIAGHLDMGLPQFYDTYSKAYSKHTGWRLLKSKLGSTDCVFLGEDKKCGIHAVRPGQCSTYPWWPEMMTEEGWRWEKENLCEGFDHPDAGELDVVSAAKQLRDMTIQSHIKSLSHVKYNGGGK